MSPKAFAENRALESLKRARDFALTRTGDPHPQSREKAVLRRCVPDRSSARTLVREITCSATASNPDLDFWNSPFGAHSFPGFAVTLCSRPHIRPRGWPKVPPDENPAQFAYDGHNRFMRFGSQESSDLAKPS